jgi:hypothetical protein|tara:strand:- start:316 stop:501 length:186 start_codon:yes stop_codon:yes gene_type:complete
MEILRRIFKRKSKVEEEKRTYEKKIDHSNDITFENEVKKPEIKNKKAKETKETKSSMVSGQ